LTQTNMDARTNRETEGHILTGMKTHTARASSRRGRTGESEPHNDVLLYKVFLLPQNINDELNYYPNYSTRRLYFGEVETPYSTQNIVHQLIVTATDTLPQPPYTNVGTVQIITN